MKQKKSLKHTFFSFFIVSIIILVIIQIISLKSVFSQLETERRQKVSDYLSSTSNVFQKNMETISSLQKIISHTPAATSYLIDQSEQRRVECRQELLRLQALTSPNYGIILFGTNHNILFSSPDLPEPLIRKISEANTVAKDQFQIYHEEDSIFRDIFLYSYAELSIPNTSYVGMNHLGAVAVTARINITELSYSLSYDENFELILEKNKNKQEIAMIRHRGTNQHESTMTIDVPHTSWQLSGSYFLNYMQSSTLKLASPFILIEPLILLIMILFMNAFYKQYINQPVNQITSFLNNYVILNKNTKIDQQNTLEFDTIVNHINHMIRKNEQLSREILKNQQNLYERELEDKKALFYTLQLQINPHFLYNTLDCIRSIAHIKGIPEIMDISIALSHITRYSLNSHAIVTLEQELSMLQEYITILSIRQPQRYMVKVDVGKNLYQYEIIKMILQPVVENSIKHNSKLRNPLHISITGRQEENKLCIDIQDDGIGIAPDQLTLIQQNLENNLSLSDNHIGLNNINYRLKLHYGNSYGITVDSKQFQLTTIHIELPAKFYESAGEQ